MAPLDSFQIVNSEKHTQQKLDLRERIVAAVGFVAPKILARKKQKNYYYYYNYYYRLDVWIYEGPPVVHMSNCT